MNSFSDLDGEEGIRIKNIFQFDQAKGLEILVYITQKISALSLEKKADLYNVLKCAFFAEKMHLGEYGRMICGDNYVAMAHGPVPSHLYDMVKLSRGDGDFAFYEVNPSSALEVSGNALKTKRNYDDSYLSESDKECLDKAISLYGLMPFSELKKKSHADPSYKTAMRNGTISLEDFVMSLPNGEEVMDYLKTRPVSAAKL